MANGSNSAQVFFKVQEAGCSDVKIAKERGREKKAKAKRPYIIF